MATTARVPRILVYNVQTAAEADQRTAIADKGYSKGEVIVASKDADISVVVPKPMASNAGVRGQFDKSDFAYDGDKDVYVCPQART